MVPIIRYEPGETPERLREILGRADATWNADVERQVAEVIADVRKRGDVAIIESTRRLHGAELSAGEFFIPGEACREALDRTPQDLADAIRAAADNVRRFHEHQKRTSWFTEDGDGVILGKKYLPVAAAAMYVPGGTAPLVSSVYMGVVPARVAGVERVVICTPPGPDGSVDDAILAAAAIAGADGVYRVAGVAGVAALAYGTESIDPVDIIVGPSGQHVQATKKAVLGTVGIDMIAGPSEIVVIADETGNARWIAADMLSQAEHGSGFESSVAIVTDEALAEAITRELATQTNALSRSDAIRRALANYGAVFVVAGYGRRVQALRQDRPGASGDPHERSVGAARQDPQRRSHLPRWSIDGAGRRLLRGHQSRAPDRPRGAVLVVAGRG